ncbi:unnamed protein product [Caretta caretta]
MKKDLLVKDHGIRLLEAQIATGGIIDPVHSHRLPVEVAYKRGYFDEEMNRILCDPSDDTKGFFDPNTHENLTYMQLLSRCVPDPDTGLLMLQLMHKGSVLFQLDEQTRISLQSAPATVSVGLFQGQNVTVWELLFSRYVPDQKRQELLKKYKAGTLTIQEMTTIITTLITETEKRAAKSPEEWKAPAERREHPGELPAPLLRRTNKRKRLSGSPPSMYRSASSKGEKSPCGELLFSKYLSEEKRQEVLEKYRAGTVTLEELVRILTTIVEEKEERSSKLKFSGLRREAVTGYTDPYTGNKISLFQAMKKDLLVKDHGIRLLEAQIATGGIIDPVHSHRLPVEVAYKRGYFDEEMNRILCDPSDDTKGFFDPNTHENLTYMQLLSRCVPDPDTGLLMLQLMHKGSVLFQLDEQT